MNTSCIDARLRAILEAQAHAWNQGDAADWGAAFTEDADFVNVRGQVFRGRAAIVEQHARVFAGPFLGSRTEVTIRRVEPIADGIVLIDAMHAVTGFKFLPPGVTATAEGVLRTCMKTIAREDGQRWQFVSAQNTAVLPGAGGC